MALDAAKFMSPRTCGSPSWPGRCLQAGYVDADCLDRIAEITCGRAGHTFFERRQRRGILSMMQRSCRQFTKTDGAQFATQRLLADRDAEFVEHPLRQVD